MKYNSLSAFLKQIQAATPNHFSSIYSIAMKDAFERRYLAKKLYLFLRHYRPNMELESIADAKHLSLQSDSLFSTERFVVIEDVDKWKKGDLDRLGKDLELAGSGLTVLLLGEQIPNGLFRKIEKDIVALDLSGEKPWDRKRRIGEEVLKIAKAYGKTISFDVVEALLARVGEDFALIKNEVEKLCTFVGKREVIVKGDIEAVVSVGVEESLWNVAEAVVFGGSFERPKFKDLAEVFGVLGQIRYYLNIGLELASQVEASLEPKHASLRPKQLDLLLPKCRALGSRYFASKICELFEKEVDAKTNYANFNVLWDLVVISFSHDASLTTKSIRG